MRTEQSISYQVYSSELSRVKLLNRSEELALFIKARSGCKGAKDALIKAQLRFVVGVACKYSCKYLSADDLIQYGNMGLLRAYDDYEPGTGCRFGTYAVNWIRSYIQSAISDAGMIRIPRNKSAEVKLHVSSLDRACSKNNPDTPLVEILPDESEVNEIGYQMCQLMVTLSDRERKILNDVVGLDDGPRRTLRHIAKYMKISRERTRQIKDRAFDKVKRRYERLIKSGM